MEKILGTNLGNWLVLEKWMQPEFFEGTGAEDEVWLNRLMTKEELIPKMKKHRDTYVTEEDFAFLAECGMNSVRLPVPYFVFGDYEPFIGCIEYVDQAFNWAEKYGLKILLDLHTVPDSQNGYDNGGITGVCKWCKKKENVKWALSVLERLAKRYGSREGLLGIEVLNEPISFLVYATAPSTGKARDKQEAKGSGYVPMKFLKHFYICAYECLRKNMPEDKIIVFHDGFRTGSWGDFFNKNKMKNVMLDTHIYLFAMEKFVPFHSFWVYEIYMKYNERLLKKVSKKIPVIVGEWCISAQAAWGQKDPEKVKENYNKVAAIQRRVWDQMAGHFYWNYQLGRNIEDAMDEVWKESWDFRRCIKNGWMSYR